LKINKNVATTYDFLEVPEDIVNRIYFALKTYCKLEKDEKFEEIRDFVGEVLSKNDSKDKDMEKDLKNELENITSFDSEFIPQISLDGKYFENFEGMVSFYIGDEKQLRITYWEERKDYYERKDPNFTLWLNKYCVGMVETIIETKGESVGNFIMDRIGDIASCNTYLDAQGFVSNKVKLTIKYYLKDGSIAINKDGMEVKLNRELALALYYFILNM
jgi:hypothetical protein